MHVLAVNQFYAPDHSATAQLLTELCEDLVAAGEEVTVVASRGSYLGGQRWPAREVRRGVRIVRPPSTSLGKARLAHRVGDYASFGASSFSALLSQTRPDVILALTTPPLLAASALLAARARGVPLVSWVQDVYPEVAAALGPLREGSRSYRILRYVTQLTHQNCARIVALSEGMRARLVHQGASPSSIEVIPNWSDGAEIRAREGHLNAFREEHGLGGRFVAMYSGNLGAGHEFQTFIDAARLLRELRPEALLLFIGDGSRRAEAARAAEDLPNVRFLPYQPRGRLAESLSAADVHLISLRDDLAGLLVPSKLYGAMASGRPVCYVGPESCEVARAVAAADCGSTFRVGDAAGLASALATLCERPEERLRLGQRARRAFEAHYDRPVAVRAWRRVLLEAARPASPTDPCIQGSRPIGCPR